MQFAGINSFARAFGLSNRNLSVANNDQSSESSDAIPKVVSGGRSVEGRRSELRRTSQETLDVIQRGRYELNGKSIDLKTRTQDSCKATKFYASDSALKEWATLKAMTRTSSSTGSDRLRSSPTHISVLQISTIDAARLLNDMHHNNPSESGDIIGVLNFASAIKPGGAFQNGTDGQEQSIARSSTLHSTFFTYEAQQFYKLHGSQNKGGYYSHAMVYSPKVTVFRDDDGRWAPKFEIDVLSCAAVNVNMVLSNAGDVNKRATTVSVEKEMKERMGRILFLFEQNGVQNIILGAFGTGSFYNDVATVARIWAQLLVVPSARFKKSFGRIIFAIMGKPTYDVFNNAFVAWEQQEGSQSDGSGLSTSI
jgi:uncharacterized protein (TIGR02452 family)